MRLILGTAKIGMPSYGVNSPHVLSDGESSRIIRTAAVIVDTVDTAAAYGDAEERLGYEGIRWARLVTKVLPLLSAHPDHLSRAVASLVVASSERCAYYYPFHGVLLHTPGQVHDPAMRAALFALRDDGLAEHVGVSAYEPADALAALEYGCDMVQVPYSLVDQRHERAGVFKEAKARGALCYVRSPFLLGALIHPPVPCPPEIAEVRKFARSVRMQVPECGGDAQVPIEELAMRFAATCDADGLVFGVSSVAQLEQNVAVARAEHHPADDVRETCVELFGGYGLTVPSLWAVKEEQP